LKLSGQFEITRSEKRKIETGLKIPSGLLVRLGKQESRNIEIIRRLEKEAKPEKQILFFGCSVEQLKLLQPLLGTNLKQALISELVGSLAEGLSFRLKLVETYK
jgi:hypothetical protein